MKNQLIIPSIIIAAAILGGFWMLRPPSELKPPSKPQKLIVIQKPEISIFDAIRGGNFELVKQHLAAGTDVNMKEYQFEFSSLQIAAQRDLKEIVELLIANGADVNAKDRTNSTPLMVAASKGHKEICALLIAKGAFLNEKTEFGFSPLDYSEINKRTSTAKLLRKHGGKHGSIIGAASPGEIETVKEFLALGADVNAMNWIGTAMDNAMRMGHIGVADLLHKHGGKTRLQLKAEGK